MNTFIQLFIQWFIKNHPDKQELVYKALSKWCAEYELEWFNNLDKQKQLLAITNGELRTCLTDYEMRDLLLIYGEELDETILEKLGTPIELAKWIGDFKQQVLLRVEENSPPIELAKWLGDCDNSLSNKDSMSP